MRKRVLSCLLTMFVFFSTVSFATAATNDSSYDDVIIAGIVDGWRYCHNSFEGTLYKQKGEVKIYLFEEYTITNVFSVNETIHVLMYDEKGEYFLADAVSELIIKNEELEDDFELFATSNETEVFNFCIEYMGLNTAAACAVVANIYCESSFNPNAKGDYVDGVHTSYGICQWHNSRYTNLINWCNNNGYDYTTLTGQLNFLMYELKNSYKSVWNKLTTVENTADGCYDAAAYWCARYEVPAGYGYWQDGVLYYGKTSIARGDLAKNTYWTKYVNTASNSNTGNANKLVEYLLDKVGESFTSNACQAFVYQSLYNCFGVSNTKVSCCATKAWQNYGISSSRDNIPLGAAVYFGGSNVTDSTCGQQAGHVGLYVGNGDIVHAWSSQIKKTTIDYVISCGYPYRGWGWQGDYALSEMPSAPTNVTTKVWGSNVTVSWDASENATYYDVYLVQEPWGWEDIKYSKVSYSTSCTFENIPVGYYQAFVISRPNADTVQSNWTPFYIESIPPVVTLSADSTTISVGDTVTFSYNVKNSTYRALVISYGDVRYDTIVLDNENGQISYTFTEEHDYWCAIESWNETYPYDISGHVYISVLSEPPKNTWISSDKSSIAIDEELTLNWAANDCEGYWLCIYRNGGEVVFDSDMNTAETITLHFDLEGEYVAQIEARNSSGHSKATFKFDVEGPEEYTITLVEYKEMHESIYAEVNVVKNADRDDVDTIIIAVYKDSMLIDRIYMCANFAKGQTAVFGGYLEHEEGVTLKAFVLDDIQGVKSISNVVEK